MKYIIRALICAILIIVFMSSTATVYCGTGGNYGNDKQMDYGEEKDDKGNVTNGYLMYDVSAKVGKQTVYRCIGLKFYFFSQRYSHKGMAYKTGDKPYKFETIVKLVPGWQTIDYNVPQQGVNTVHWKIPFLYPTDRNSVTANTIVSRMLNQYSSSANFMKEIKDFFSTDNTIYIDQVFTVVENGSEKGWVNENGTYGGEIYMTETSLRGARSWSEETKHVLGQYFNLYCHFKGLPLYEAPTAIISRDMPEKGKVIDTSTDFNKNNEITLYGDKSEWPNYAVDKYYRWEYKPTSESKYKAIEGKGLASVPLNGLKAGSYNVRLTIWYSTSDGKLHDDLPGVKNIIMNIDDAGVIITPTIGDEIIVTQAQINANANISVPVSALAQLMNYKDASKISKWVIHMRKEPSGSDDQYQAFTYTSGLGLTQSASKTFTIPAGVLKNADYYTQYFAVSALCTVNGTAVSSSTVTCSITLKKELNKPVAILTAPSSTVAGQLVTLSGEKSYSKNGSIVAYKISIPDIGWSVSTVSGQVGLPYGKDSYEVTLTVTDSLGMTDTDTKTISISAPLPNPMITVSGKLKEYRICYLKADDFFDFYNMPHMYAVDYSKTTWKVKSVDSTGADMSTAYVITHIDTDPSKVEGDVYKEGAAAGIRTLPMIFKNKGNYDITVTLVNSLGMSNSVTKRITIAEDIAPVSKVITQPIIHREIAAEDGYYSRLTVTDESYSPDGDYIAYRKIYTIYDANNNGTFGDGEDKTIVIDESSDRDYIENNRTFTKMIKDVGKYRTYLVVEEGFVP